MSYVAGHRFLHVGLNIRKGAFSTEKFDALMNQATSWYRYAPNCWLLYTGGTPTSWWNHLAPHITREDYMLIVEIQPKGYQGWLPAEAWKWMTDRGAVP
jgi:hypothetical protein